MNLELHLPIWAILYCGLIFANGILTIKISNNKTIIYTISQLTSTAFMISFFFLYYGAVKGVNDKTIYLIMVLFILFQEVLVNRELYKTVIIEQIPPQERDIALIVLAIITIIFLLPLIYVTTIVFI